MQSDISFLILSLLIAISIAAPDEQLLSNSFSKLSSIEIPSSLLTPFSIPTTYDYGSQTATFSPQSLRNSTAASFSASGKITTIGGETRSIVPTDTTSAISSSVAPQRNNSQTCNGFTEFCNRRFSNISMVVAHNSPFVVPHNAASNQLLPVLTQLDDGIRGLQTETHVVNGTLRLCHTSCSLLDAGPLQDYLSTVATWLAVNPYEVVAIMMGNDNRVAPTEYIRPFQESGILQYVYTPNETSYSLDQWPTLAEMILKNTRVVVYLDYGANQTQVPWLMDEFAYQWQTPFSPTDPAFPCTEQRPPNQPNKVSRNKMYMANHNLNIAVSIGSTSLLIPAYTLLEQVNSVSGNGSLGRMVDNCTAMWNRAPNWLLVDYYNLGNINGSVFQVAATANNVSYVQGSCCGTLRASAAHKTMSFSTRQKAVFFASAVLLALLIVLLNSYMEGDISPAYVRFWVVSRIGLFGVKRVMARRKLFMQEAEVETVA